MGTVGNEQIAFNRNRLIVVDGRRSLGKLDDFVRSGQFNAKAGGAEKGGMIVATYEPDASNDGLAATLRFTGEAPDRKLTLNELSSRRVGRSARLIARCRDETIERFFKTYRMERDKEPPRTVTLVCMEYQLSTRGGRTCR